MTITISTIISDSAPFVTEAKSSSVVAHAVNRFVPNGGVTKPMIKFGMGLLNYDI